MESTLSSQTSPNHSTFIVKWDQVGMILKGSAVKGGGSVSRALGMGHWAKQ